MACAVHVQDVYICGVHAGVQVMEYVCGTCVQLCDGQVCKIVVQVCCRYVVFACVLCVFVCYADTCMCLYICVCIHVQTGTACEHDLKEHPNE